jgi:opacity protein-like surface antigen
MDRRHETTEIGTDITDPDPNNQFVVVNRSFDGKAKTHQLAPAVAAMAGFTYNLNPGMVLDVGYRFTYIGAVDFSTHINFSQPIDGQRQATSRLTIDDTYEHALRAGIRWNVW